jgi:hypothetical protein
MKVCNKCRAEKIDNDFSTSNFLKDSGWCRACTSSYRKKHYEENKQDTKAWQQKYYQKNREEVVDRSKKNYQDNKDEKLAYAKRWHQQNKTSLNIKRKNRRKNDPIFRLRQDVSRLVNIALNKQNSNKNGKSISKYLPYTITELWIHIENQFLLLGNEWMCRNNQGDYDPAIWDDNDSATWAWQLDHIIPQSDLPYTSMEDDNFQKCWALKNLRPYSAKQNILDGVNRTRHASVRRE